MNSSAENSNLLPEYAEYLAKATSIRWEFHIIGTMARQTTDAFKAEKAALRFLGNVGKFAHEPVKNLEWFLRVEEHNSTTLHCHILLGSYKLVDQRHDRETVKRFLRGSWEAGICAVEEINPNTLTYVCKAGLPHCVPSKRLKRLARRDSPAVSA